MKNLILEHLSKDKVKENLKTRHIIKNTARNYLTRTNFLEIDTPVLGPKLSEYSDSQFQVEVTWGRKWWLPQSPQLYSQIAVISGIEKYFQFPHCFRPEEHDPNRKDQAYEFIQIDIEMAADNTRQIMSIAEEMIVEICEAVGLGKIVTPFPSIDAVECIKKYNTDKPDFRKQSGGLEFLWVTDFPLVDFSCHGKECDPFPSHHVFALPHHDIRNISKDTEKWTCKTHSFDLVLNGMEIGGGDLRIHDMALQEAVLDLFKADKSEFKYLLGALESNAPHHGGMAIGLERFLMQLSGTTDIADVNAFSHWNVR